VRQQGNLPRIVSGATAILVAAMTFPAGGVAQGAALQPAFDRQQALRHAGLPFAPYQALHGWVS
jgi:hypothetical protein